jgi:ATP-binding cassette subfamily C protein
MADSIITWPHWFETGLARFLVNSEKCSEAGGNQPLWLSAEDAVWFIARGQVEIFAVGKQEFPPVARRHVATFVAGEVFFSSHGVGGLGQHVQVEDSERYPHLELIAVPHPHPQLIRVDAAVFDQLSCELGSQVSVEQAVRVWANKFQNIFSRKPYPLSTIPLVAGEKVHLEIPGLSAQSADDLVWVRSVQGCSAVCGHDKFPLQPKDGPLPLCGGSWVTSQQEARLECLNTRQMFENGMFWRGVGCLYQSILQYLTTQSADSARLEWSRLENRIQLDTQVLTSANAQLAAVLTSSNFDDVAKGSGAPERTASLPENHRALKPPRRAKEAGGRAVAATDADSAGPDPLGEVCRLVAHKIGISLRLPPNPVQTLPMVERLQRLCDASHLHSRKVLLRGDWWRHDNGPLVAFISWKQDAEGQSKIDLHPVALLPASSASYQLVEPANGASRLVDAVVAKSLHEQAYMLYPGSIENLGQPRKLARRIVQHYGRDLLAILFMAFAGGLLNMSVPIVTGAIYGRVIPHGSGTELKQLALVLLAAALGACGFQITRALSVLRLTGKVETHLQPLVWGRLLELPVSFYRRFRVGDLADRVQGIGTIRELLLADVTTTSLALVTSIASFALLFYYSWHFALLATGMVACLVSVTAVLALLQMRHRHRSIEIQGKISSLEFALIQGIAKLRSSGAEIRSYGVWVRQLADQSRHALHAQNTAALQAGVNAFYLIASELALFALMGLGLTKHLSLSRFLAFSAAFGQVQVALLTFITLIPELLIIFPIYKRLQPILEEAAEADESKTAVGLSGDIEVRNVSFRYQEHGRFVLDSISFKAHRGEFVAIVGPSGSGKSTLIRLLLGFERPTSGVVLYDNLDLASLDVKSVRRQIGTVLQNSKPVTGDIFTNIVGGTSNDLSAAWEAARIAGIDDEIKAMPMGLHTIIGEGATTFSGGERQRLMIARAVVNRPHIILLDEATSALDNPTQDKVQRCLEQMNATRIVVAHRLSTIRNADRIYVFDGGRIIEEGTYEDLMSRCGYFADIAGRQI